MTGDDTKRGGFTLVELLIVIALLGALATIVIPQLSADRERVLDDSIVPTEMMNIRNAFTQFVADCVPSQSDYEELVDIGKGLSGSDLEKAQQEGLAVLWDINWISDKNFDFPSTWDKDREKGWRGPYLIGMNNIEHDNHRLRDPLFNENEQGRKGYYMVVNDGDSLYLLYTGNNGKDDSKSNYAGDPGGDDKILLLAPNALK